jgi:hypothetical protein
MAYDTYWRRDHSTRRPQMAVTGSRTIGLTLHSEYFRGPKMTGFRPREADFGGYMTATPHVVRFAADGGRPTHVCYPSIIDFSNGVNLKNVQVGLTGERSIFVSGKMEVGDGIKLLGIKDMRFGVFPFADKITHSNEIRDPSREVKFHEKGSSFSGEMKLPEDVDPLTFDGWLNLSINARIGEALSRGHYSEHNVMAALPLPGDHALGLETMFHRFASQVASFGAKTINIPDSRGLRPDGMDIEVIDLVGRGKGDLVGIRILGDDMPSIPGVDGTYFVKGIPFALSHDREGNPTHMLFPSLYDAERDIHLASFNVGYEPDGRVRLHGRMRRGDDTIEMPEVFAVLLPHGEKVYSKETLAKCYHGGVNFGDATSFDLVVKAPRGVDASTGGWGLLKVHPDFGQERGEFYTTFPLPSGRMEAFGRMMKALMIQLEEQDLRVHAEGEAIEV